MKKTVPIMLLSLLLLSGCSVCKSIPWCANWKPIWLSKADHANISDGLARSILAHNKLGEEMCGS